MLRWIIPTGDVSDDAELVAALEEDHAAEHGTAAEQIVAAAVAAPPPTIPTPPKTIEVPAVALTVGVDEAAALLSVSPDTFERHVLPELRVVQIGRRKLIPVRELEDFVNRRRARALRD